MGNVAGHDFSISTRSSVGIRSRSGESQTQRLRAAVQLAADVDNEVAQLPGRSAANSPMTAPAFQRCGQVCDQCQGTAWRWLKWAALTVAAVAVLILAVAITMAKTPDTVPICHYEGRSFSVGSLIVVPGNQGRECRENDNRKSASWYPIRFD